MNEFSQEYYRVLQSLKGYVELEVAYGGRYSLLEENTPQESQESQSDSPLSTLQELASNCTQCKLAQTRKQVVFGSGPAKAKVVVVGEAPGYHEDQQGFPFVGEAGQLLTKMLASIELSREQDVYICNVIKCRPPKNRDPEAEEIAACTPWLKQQLQLLSPTLICAMGRFAACFLSGTDQAMWKFRGNTYEYAGIPVICTYHPAYLLRNPNDKRKAWEDLKRIKKFLEEN